MRWASAVSEEVRLEDAVRAVAGTVLETLGGIQPDIAFVFVSDAHFVNYTQLPALLKDALGPALIVGCTASGTIGGGHEVEHRPSLSLTVASLPGVAFAPFHIGSEQLPSPDAAPDQWETLVGAKQSDSPSLLILADAYSLQTEEMLEGLDYAFPASSKLGGLASGGQGPRQNALYLNSEVYREGAVGVAFTGNVVLDTVVAQGCRPIGEPMRITKCRDNLLEQIDGRPALDVMQELFQASSEKDRQLMSNSLFLGIVMDEFKEDYHVGDFLIRNLIRIQPRVGGVYIGAILREQQTIQFHVRDAQTATEDLEAMLAHYVQEKEAPETNGALLFSCVGRGEYLFGRPDHDTDLLRSFIGTAPLGGFFCNGEIGRVGNYTYLHGYTSSFGLFRHRWPE